MPEATKPEATKVQSDIMRALEALGFKFQPNPPKVGGPMKFTATDKALDALKGKTVTVKSDGKVTVA